MARRAPSKRRKRERELYHRCVDALVARFPDYLERFPDARKRAVV